MNCIVSNPLDNGKWLLTNPLNDITPERNNNITNNRYFSPDSPTAFFAVSIWRIAIMYPINPSARHIIATALVDGKWL
jgi:hypothetical protein